MVQSSWSTVVSCVVAVLVAVTTAAPVAQEQLDSLRTALKTQLKEQEALENLASLSGTSGVEYTKTNAMSYSNVNGAQETLQKAEDKVVDPVTEKVVSDVKEEVEQAQAGPGDKPVTSLQASIDIPDKGIHKVIADTDSQDKLDRPLMQEMKSPVEFTPAVVADYLYRTGEQQEFKDVLNDLVDAGEILPEEAEQYEKTVMDELYKLDQSEQVTDDENPQIADLYPFGGPQPMFPAYNGMQDDVMYPPAFPNDEGAQQQYMDYLIPPQEPVSLDEMISKLLEAWLNKAILSGDPEAEEILTNIVDYVSRDNNPDDEAQVKQILSDIFAEALLEDLTPRMVPRQADDVNMLPEDSHDHDNPIVKSAESQLKSKSEETKERIANILETPKEQSKDDKEEKLKM